MTSPVAVNQETSEESGGTARDMTDLFLLDSLIVQFFKVSDSRDNSIANAVLSVCKSIQDKPWHALHDSCVVIYWSTTCATRALSFWNANTSSATKTFYLIFFLPMARQPLGGLCLVILRRFTITHFLDTRHSVGLLWTSDQPVAETSTWQHTILTRDRHPCPRRNSNPQSQQAIGRRPTP
jgi:hypothetical protein